MSVISCPERIKRGEYHESGGALKGDTTRSIDIFREIQYNSSANHKRNEGKGDPLHEKATAVSRRLQKGMHFRTAVQNAGSDL